MRITPAFLDDLAEYNLFTRYRQGSAQVAMVHGGQDQVAPVKAAQRFATRFGARLTILPQGEHNLMGAGELEQVLSLAVAFLQGRGTENLEKM